MNLLEIEKNLLCNTLAPIERRQPEEPRALQIVFCLLPIWINFFKVTATEKPHKQAKCGQRPQEADVYPQRMRNV